MDEHETLPPPLAGIVEALEQSRADLAAGRVDDFDVYLLRVRQEVEHRIAKAEGDQGIPASGWPVSEDWYHQGGTASG